ncbi:uncharacterized protein RCO7_02970 [Rhynchosporium graminicola]|uniref:Uncharacterized protein n=1 Tax=Rhynchosporium graminicola TaxID=2792576 RepID=A0A1E1KR28_9HELO|nr:uncharacterized protein RCO7_02970 [Rhynchosporium commune]
MARFLDKIFKHSSKESTVPERNPERNTERNTEPSSKLPAPAPAPAKSRPRQSYQEINDREEREACIRYLYCRVIVRQPELEKRNRQFMEREDRGEIPTRREQQTDFEDNRISGFTPVPVSEQDRDLDSHRVQMEMQNRGEKFALSRKQERDLNNNRISGFTISTSDSGGGDMDSHRPILRFEDVTVPNPSNKTHISPYHSLDPGSAPPPGPVSETVGLPCTTLGRSACWAIGAANSTEVPSGLGLVLLPSESSGNNLQHPDEIEDGDKELNDATPADPNFQRETVDGLQDTAIDDRGAHDVSEGAASNGYFGMYKDHVPDQEVLLPETYSSTPPVAATRSPPRSEVPAYSSVDRSRNPIDGDSQSNKSGESIICIKVHKPIADLKVTYKMVMKDIIDSTYLQDMKNALALELVDIIQEQKVQIVQGEVDSPRRRREVTSPRQSRDHNPELDHNQELINKFESLPESPVTKHVIAQLKRDKKTTRERWQLYENLDIERNASPAPMLAGNENERPIANSGGVSGSERDVKRRKGSTQRWTARNWIIFGGSKRENVRVRPTVTNEVFAPPLYVPATAEQAEETKNLGKLYQICSETTKAVQSGQLAALADQ